MVRGLTWSQLGLQRQALRPAQRRRLLRPAAGAFSTTPSPSTPSNRPPRHGRLRRVRPTSVVRKLTYEAPVVEKWIDRSADVMSPAMKRDGVARTHRIPLPSNRRKAPQGPTHAGSRGLSQRTQATPTMSIPVGHDTRYAPRQPRRRPQSARSHSSGWRSLRLCAFACPRKQDATNQ